MSKLLFNRFHIASTQPIKNKVTFLLEGLNSETVTTQGTFSYRILDISTETDGYITGNLVKYDPRDEGEFVDEKTMKITEGYVENRIIGRSVFLLNVAESLLIFEEIKNNISKVTFKRIFSELFNKSFTEDFMVSFQIDTLKERYSFIEKVKELKHINKISIILIPSNPRFSPYWEEMDERLRKGNITKYKEIQTSNKAVGIKVDEITESKFMMAEDGYGESSAVGTDKDGRTITFSTRTKEQDESQPLPIDVKRGGIGVILNHISGKLANIMERTKNEKKDN
jgi:hypothetical protein